MSSVHSLDEDLSIYATPRPETPYGTPNSTPRLIHCRLNPVKTIRERVPLKIHFADETAVPEQGSLSKLNEIKPVNTKKIRCVIQPNPLYENGDGDRKNSNELCSDDVKAHCHSKGDAVTVISDNQPDESAVIKEIELMDEFFKGSIKRLQTCCDGKSNDGCDTIRDNCDKSDKHKSKPQARKSSVPENHDQARKCEKKKFYDPQDIRKYMLKKKSERQAKEKEQKCKKETEALALKRKVEATKMLTKTRIPVSKHYNEREIEKAKNLKHSKCENSSKHVPVEKTTGNQRYSKADEKRENSQNHCDPVKTNHNEKAPHIDDPEKQFIKKFNDIIHKCAETAAKMTDAELVRDDFQRRFSAKIKTPENSPKIVEKRAESVPTLPKELDVLKSKNPYNFLNILKGKVNLAKNIEDTNYDENDDDILAKAFVSSSPKRKTRSKIDKDKFLEDIIKRRLKLGNSEPLTTKLSEIKIGEYENIEPMKLTSHLSRDFKPQVNETYRVAEKNDRTFVLCKDDDMKSVSELSGIKSLTASEEQLVKKTCDEEVDNDAKISSNLGSALSLESLKVQDISLSLPDSFINPENEPIESSPNFKKFEESIFKKDAAKSANLFANKQESVGNDVRKLMSNETPILSSDELANISTTAVFLDIYDQMIKSEDEKLSQILLKIHQQKEALNKYLRNEIFALESKKNIYRESKDEEQIKTIKKRQRAVLLKITKNVQELDKMKKSVIETVERRKAEILRQKIAMKEKKELLKQKFAVPKKKKTEGNKTFLVSKQTNTFFMGISSSSSTSIFVENGDNKMEEDKYKDELESTKEDINDEADLRICRVKDTATSPVHFNNGISIRLELDPEKLLKLKSPCGEIKIDTSRVTENYVKSQTFLEPSELEDNVDSKSREYMEDKTKKIKIKRPLSPIVLPATKKVSQMRRLSSSSDVTFASFNDTTTDQSDVELRISALQEQLKQRKLEAERLRREEKQLRKEKLKAKEQSLIKQLEAYDDYIERVTKMLSEDKNLVEVAKPQIKSIKRPSFTDITDRKIKMDLNEMLVPVDQKVPNRYADVDGENSEDSEKRLRKADSGILMESEVTEVSENVEIRKSKSESEIHSEAKSERAEKSDSEKASGSKSVDNFLQLINDIQSQVASMSEQVYSSDFVEDIPEDVPDTKSETEGSTSVSIEEIFSDSHPDSEPRASSVAELKKYEVTERDVQQSISNETKNIKDQSESDGDIFIVKNISDIESVSDQVKPDSSQDRVHVSEEIKSIDSYKNIDADKIKSIDSAVNITESLPAEIKSASSLETPTTDVKETSIFFNLQDDNANDAANIDSMINHEFVKYESEGSNVPDVDEPVYRIDDIETMINGFDVTLSNDSQSEISDKVQKNFDEVLKNLESYFSIKISPVQTEELNIESLHQTNLEKVTERKPNEGFEETDISESLEYDTTSLDNSDPKNKESKPDQVTDLDEDDKSKVSSEKSPAKKNTDEFSNEEDRSVEEFLEDYSMPNIGATFIVNEDSESEISREANHSVEIRTLTPSPISAISEKHSELENELGNEDLDQKISMDQTPFLQALRREQETLFGQKSEMVDDVAGNNLDEYVEKIHTKADTKDGGFDESNKVSDTVNKTDTNETNNKVDESFLRKYAEKKFDNEWFDKESSFSHERLREAEELRLQQMRIEQEIEELQAQQHIPPYLYIREIPNKPPPPYTPPSEHNSIKIPNNEMELCSLISPAIQYICSSLKKGVRIDEIKQLPEYTPNGKSNTEANSYKKFIFDLTKEVARSMLESNKPKKCLPWENLSKNNKPKLTPGEELLPKMIENEILILFGFKSKIQKEKLIIQWSRKKRNDFVDDLLIKELQEEEAEWTNYEEDENIIKNQITQNLLDDLIQDTVDSLQDAIKVKNSPTNK